MRVALDAVAPGGAIAFAGVQPRPVDGVDLNQLVLKDATAVGVLNGPGLYDEMIAELASGSVSADLLIDREFGLDEAEAAFARLAERRRRRPKVLLRVGS